MLIVQARASIFVTYGILRLYTLLCYRMWDAFDFATVSLTVTEVAKEFGVDNSEMTWVRILFCEPCETHGYSLTNPIRRASPSR